MLHALFAVAINSFLLSTQNKLDLIDFFVIAGTIWFNCGFQEKFCLTQGLFSCSICFWLCWIYIWLVKFVPGFYTVCFWLLCCLFRTLLRNPNCQTAKNQFASPILFKDICPYQYIKKAPFSTKMDESSTINLIHWCFFCQYSMNVFINHVRN